MSRLLTQLRLIGAQVAQQDARLSLADVEAGELTQPLCVITPITYGDMNFEPARIIADGLQRYLVDGEAQIVQAPDGALDAVTVGEAEYRFSMKQLPQRLVSNPHLLGLGDQLV